MKSKRFLLSIVTMLLMCVASIREVVADELRVPKNFPARFTVFLPIGNAKLVRRKIKGAQSSVMPPYLYTETCGVADKALTLLFQKAPTSFPKGTHLTKASRVEKYSEVMEISLSKEFWQRGFWSSKAKVSSAIYAMVNTATAYNQNTDYVVSGVQFLKAGQMVRNLANLDLRKPLAPRYEMVTSWITDSSDALWISPPKKREAHWAEVFIGERRSLRSGERSALRWLSRLIQQKPRAKLYRVEWWAVDRGVWWPLLLSYSPPCEGETGRISVLFAESSFNTPPPQLLELDKKRWIGIDNVEVHAVARKGGTLRAFARYARDIGSL